MAFSTLIGEGAGTITTGQRKLADLTAARIRPQVIDKLFYDNAGLAPLTALMRKLSLVKQVGNSVIDHYETDEMPLNIEVDGAHTAAATSLAVTTNHGNRTVVNDLLMNVETNEIIRVTAVGASTLTVTRAYAGTSGAAMGDNDELKFLGMADTEGNTAPAAKSSEPTKVQHYVQTRKMAVELSRRDLNADVFGEDEKARIMRDQLNSLRNRIEQHYLFSNGYQSTDPTVSYGLPGRVTTNVTDMNNVALDEQSWYTWLKNCSINNAVDSSKVFVFVGSNISEALDSFGRDVIRYAPDDKKLGLACSQYQSSFGTVTLHRHPLLDDTKGSGASYGIGGGRAYYLNMACLGRLLYKGGPGGSGDYRLQPDVEATGTDGKKWQWIVDEGLIVMSEHKHGILREAASLS